MKEYGGRCELQLTRLELDLADEEPLGVEEQHNLDEARAAVRFDRDDGLARQLHEGVAHVVEHDRLLVELATHTAREERASEAAIRGGRD